MPDVGLVIKLEARPGKEGDLRAFLASAQPLAEAEPGTPIWLALETGPSTFWIVDAFPGDAERQAHLDGAIPAALLPRADELLAEPPTILPATVLGAKPA